MGGNYTKLMSIACLDVLSGEKAKQNGIKFIAVQKVNKYVKKCKVDQSVGCHDCLLVNKPLFSKLFLDMA